MHQLLQILRHRGTFSGKTLKMDNRQLFIILKLDQFYQILIWNVIITSFLSYFRLPARVFSWLNSSSILQAIFKSRNSKSLNNAPQYTPKMDRKYSGCDSNC